MESLLYIIGTCSVCFAAGVIIGDKFQPVEKALNIAKSWMSK